MQIQFISLDFFISLSLVLQKEIVNIYFIFVILWSSNKQIVVYCDVSCYLQNNIIFQVIKSVVFHFHIKCSINVIRQRSGKDLHFAVHVCQEQTQASPDYQFNSPFWRENLIAQSRIWTRDCLAMKPTSYHCAMRLSLMAHILLQTMRLLLYLIFNFVIFN